MLRLYAATARPPLVRIRRDLWKSRVIAGTAAVKGLRFRRSCYCTRNAEMNSTPELSLTRNTSLSWLFSVPTSELAFPCESVVMFESVRQCAASIPQTDTWKVWLAKVPANARCAVVPVAVIMPLPVAFPVGCPIPPLIEPAGNMAARKFRVLLAPDAVKTIASVLSPLRKATKFPANVPFDGKVKFTGGLPLDVAV